ncbi:MAG: bifunctional NAD(P)/FAD-dependent oxidoreductase/class I SAM-dependent methyltransferase [Rhodoglobus sp.]|tara:strand:- start:1174 stop:2751 length:1578 start_codon:yes stop_codon:yes gene_type:complete
MKQNQWDVIVIGAGPAGLSAALLLGRARRRTLVIDAGEPRNRFADHMHGVLGNEGATPRELRDRGERELALYGGEVAHGRVERVDDEADGIRVTLSDATTLAARALIVATGITDVLPSIPGLAEHWGTAVLHCPYCHGWEVSDKRLGVVPTSALGTHQAFLARQWSDDITVFTAGLGELSEEARNRFRARGVKLVDSPVAEVLAQRSQLTGVRTVDGEHWALDAILTAGAPHPHDAFLEHLDLERADVVGSSFLAVDAAGKTSHDRIWAVGNVVNPMLTVPMSIGAGAMTGAAVNGALVGEDFDIAERSQSPAAFWETRYSGEARVWSGRVNAVLADVVPDLEDATTHARTALDLGSGEGGDALWLAQRGWATIGLDISLTAIARAREAATQLGFSHDRLQFKVADLSDFDCVDTFDLVTASFLQSPVELARADILRKAASMVAIGGHLLVTAHSPVSQRATEHSSCEPDLQQPDHPTPEQELEMLDLNPAEWTVVLCELRPRQVTRSSDESFTVEDSVVLVRRN